MASGTCGSHWGALQIVLSNVKGGLWTTRRRILGSIVGPRQFHRIGTISHLLSPFPESLTHTVHYTYERKSFFCRLDKITPIAVNRRITQNATRQASGCSNRSRPVAHHPAPVSRGNKKLPILSLSCRKLAILK